MDTPAVTTSPLRVCSFESRRATEMQSLIERLGGHAVVAPSMREIPLAENAAAFEFAERLLAGQIEIMVFLTGVGARALWEVLGARYPAEVLNDALARCTVVVRGPKPTAVLREWGVRIDHRAPEPNTWRELLQTLDSEVPLAGRTMAIQEYGIANPALYEALSQRGASVMPVPVYRWALPEDLGPLQSAIHSTISQQFDVLLFTSAQQVHHVLQVAEQGACQEQWRQAATRCVIGSIGPTASETLRELALPVDVEPTHPKMGPLVKETLQAAPALLPTVRQRSVHASAEPRSLP
jgi:uroporphyrinogen-III synthase